MGCDFLSRLAGTISLILLLAGGQAAAAVYSVAQLHPAASDDNPGSTDRPFKTIGAAAKLVKPGDTVLIGTGVYREFVKIETSGTAAAPITFRAAPMARVELTGADQITDWRREEGTAEIFSTPWPYEYTGWSSRRTQPNDDYHLMIGRAEQVHVDLLRRPGRQTPVCP
jgi:hypothetical protein